MSKHVFIIAAAVVIASSGAIAFPTHVEAGGAQAKTLPPPAAGKRRILQPSPLAITDFSSSSPTKSKSKPNR